MTEPGPSPSPSATPTPAVVTATTELRLPIQQLVLLLVFIAGGALWVERTMNALRADLVSKTEFAALQTVVSQQTVQLAATNAHLDDAVKQLEVVTKALESTNQKLEQFQLTFAAKSGRIP